MSSQSTRIDWIDAARGIGIILVVYGHVARGLDTAGMSFSGFELTDTIIYSFHMPLFFALSGLFFKQSIARGPAAFLNSKISTILFPYLIWSLIQILIQFSVSHLINGTVTWKDVATFYVPRAQYWFLVALFSINLANLLAYLALKDIGLIITSILSVIVILTQVDLGILDFGVYYIVYFNAGIFLFGAFVNRESSRWPISGLIIAAFVFLSLEFFYVQERTVLLQLATGLAGIAFVFYFSRRFLWGAKHLQAIGQNSMPIFLMHVIASAAARIALQKILHVENIAVHLFVGTLLGIYLPYLLYSGFMKRYLNFLFVTPLPWRKVSRDRGQ